MRAIRVHAQGGPESLRFEEVPDPVPAEGQALVPERAISLRATLDPGILNTKGSLYLTRPSLFHYMATREELTARAADVLGWIRAGRLKLRIGLELPLRAAAEAHRALEGRKTTGKVLLLP